MSSRTEVLNAVPITRDVGTGLLGHVDDVVVTISWGRELTRRGAMCGGDFETHQSPSQPSTCVLLLLVVGVDGPRRAVLAMPSHPGGGGTGGGLWWPQELICAPGREAGSGAGVDSIIQGKCLRRPYTFQKRNVTLP